MVNIFDIAVYIFRKYSNIDEMKLHKLLYLCQRESLLLRGKPLFLQKLEAWKYGPVSKDVRIMYKNKDLDIMNCKLGKEEKYIVDNVLNQYYDLKSSDLCTLSHKEVSWKIAYLSQDKIIKIKNIYYDAKKIRAYDSLWDMYYDEFEDYYER